MATEREPAGYVPRDPGALRDHLLRMCDNILDHPVIVGRDGLDTARVLQRYWQKAPDQVFKDMADYA
jgi:hypothetical protein